MEVEDFIGKVYRLEKLENAEEFCNFMGYSNCKRRNFEADHSVVLKSDCCGFYKYVSKSRFTTTICSFKPDRSFCGVSWSNGFNKNIVSIKENCLIGEQKGRKEIKTVREFYPDSMTLTISCCNVEAKKYYKATGTDNCFVEFNLRCVYENNLF